MPDIRRVDDVDNRALTGMAVVEDNALYVTL